MIPFLKSIGEFLLCFSVTAVVIVVFYGPKVVSNYWLKGERGPKPESDNSNNPLIGKRQS